MSRSEVKRKMDDARWWAEEFLGELDEQLSYMSLGNKDAKKFAETFTNDTARRKTVAYWNGREEMVEDIRTWLARKRYNASEVENEDA